MSNDNPDPKDKSHEHTIWVDTLYGASSGLSLVQLTYQGTGVQLRPAEARSLALNILECAESAEQEHIMVALLGEITGEKLNVEQTAGVLSKLRELRAKTQEQNQ